MKITVGVPTYNRSGILKETLLSITETNFDGEWELLVVDNNSSDNTREICEKYLPDNGRYLLETKKGVSCARNRIIQEATGDLIIFTDDDTTPCPDWISAFVEAAAEYPQGNFFLGKTLWDWQTDKPWWYTDDKEHPIVFCYRSDLGSEDKLLPENVSLSGPNMAVRKNAFASVGGFDPGLGILGGIKIGGEEPDLTERMRALGMRGYYVSKAVVHHKIFYSLTTLRSLVDGIRAAGLSDSLRIDTYDKLSSRLLGMPQWWIRQLIQNPFIHLYHIFIHAILLQTTPIVYHYLRLHYWKSQVKYFFRRNAIKKGMKRS